MNNPNNNSPNNPNAFLEHVRTVIRLKHLSLHTEDSYLSTIRRFIVFHGRRHPAFLGPDALRDYLTHLAVEGHVAASTQNVARNALPSSFIPLSGPAGADGRGAEGLLTFPVTPAILVDIRML
jgi:hypothetical protein